MTPDTPRLVLASGSPRRRELLPRLGLPFDVITSGVPEDGPLPADPAAHVLHLARQKAQAVAATLEAGLVIGADTEVALGKDVLGKPADAEDAVRMLRLLCGRAHRVISGVAVVDVRSGRVEARTVTTHVSMRTCTDAQIAAYAASGEPLDKAGAYAIQGLGGALVERIEGCYFNVVGFPLCEVAALLRAFGVVINGTDPVCALADGSPCPRLAHT